MKGASLLEGVLDFADVAAIPTITWVGLTGDDGSGSREFERHCEALCSSWLWLLEILIAVQVIEVCARGC